MDGQALVYVAVDSTARTTFTFDLGCTLVTRPYVQDSEQWMLFEPDGRVLTVRADGRYSHEAGTMPHAHGTWRQIVGSAQEG